MRKYRKRLVTRHIDKIKRNRDDLELRHGRSKAYQERDDPNHPRVAGRFLFLDRDFRFSEGSWPSVALDGPIFLIHRCTFLLCEVHVDTGCHAYETGRIA